MCCRLQRVKLLSCPFCRGGRWWHPRRVRFAAFDPMFVKRLTEGYSSPVTMAVVAKANSLVSAPKNHLKHPQDLTRDLEPDHASPTTPRSRALSASFSSHSQTFWKPQPSLQSFMNSLCSPFQASRSTSWRTICLEMGFSRGRSCYICLSSSGSVSRPARTWGSSDWGRRSATCQRRASSWLRMLRASTSSGSCESSLGWDRSCAHRGFEQY